MAAATGVGLSGVSGVSGLFGAGRWARLARAQEVPDGDVPAEDQGPPPPQVARPLIVQIDNDPHARPSFHLGAASYVYEYTAEGGVTRFSAIYIGQDDVGTIGNDGRRGCPLRAALNRGRARPWTRARSR